MSKLSSNQQTHTQTHTKSSNKTHTHTRTQTHTHTALQNKFRSLGKRRQRLRVCEVLKLVIQQLNYRFGRAEKFEGKDFA